MKPSGLKAAVVWMYRLDDVTDTLTESGVMNLEK